MDFKRMLSDALLLLLGGASAIGAEPAAGVSPRNRSLVIPTWLAAAGPAATKPTSEKPASGPAGKPAESPGPSPAPLPPKPGPDCMVSC
ncbi:MAG: hypothetical protein ABSG68_14515, partial [Thermoguttaceae bacterium]